MRFLPFENITYETRLSSEEVLKRIHEIIEPKKTFRMTGIFGSNNHKPYQGSLNGNSFNITRIIGYSNSFLPRITGLVEKDFGLTKIHVKMRLHLFVLVFMSIWCVGLGFGCLVFLAASLGKGTFEPTAFIPLGMLLFGLVMVTGSFKYESIKSKKYFAQLFEAEIKE